MKTSYQKLVLNSADYEALTEGANTLEADGHGPKVLRLKDGSYLKLFRRKRLLSSALWYPYYQRFIDNCEKLNQLEIPAPTVLQMIELPHLKRVGVRYEGIEGKSLKEILKTQQITTEEVQKTVLFIRGLHNKGVYFRSLHLGNIVLSERGVLGLIDVADASFHPRALSSTLRKRNLKHFLRQSETDKCYREAQALIGKIFAKTDC